MKIIHKLVFLAGYVVGLLFGPLPRTVDRIKADFEKRNMTERPEIDPAVRKAVDHYGFDRLCRPEPDTPKMGPDELFAIMANRAAQGREELAAKTGKAISSLIIQATVTTLNRRVYVQTTFVFNEPHAETLQAVHPGPERWRLRNLDKAMRCFLN